MSDELREKIARKLYEQQGLEATDPWDDALARREGLGMDRHSGNQVACLLLADAILELPEIKEALATFERINRPNDPNSVHGVDHWAGH